MISWPAQIQFSTVTPWYLYRKTFPKYRGVLFTVQCELPRYHTFGAILTLCSSSVRAGVTKRPTVDFDDQSLPRFAHVAVAQWDD